MASNVDNETKRATDEADVGSDNISTEPSASRAANVNDSMPKTKVLGIALLLIASTSAGFLGGWLGAGKNGNREISQSTQQQIVSSESQLISNIAKTVGPSVVSVNVTSRASDSSFFGSGGEQASAGTGIIISEDGLIVTNRHVVPVGTTEVSVTLADGTELKNVEVVGRTRQGNSLDVAFLKIKDAKGKKLTPARIGDSSKVQVGDRVIAIGNALGQFQNTVTSGIISGHGRNLQASEGDDPFAASENLEDLFQTDAAINQGNSGGPLVNTSGEVIGINTAIASNAEGIGFAIPINDVKGLIKTVTTTGKFQQPYLGVRYVSLTNDIASQLDLTVTRGAYILSKDDTAGQPSVLPGSPAAKAGLKAGDIIQSVNGTNIDATHSLTSLLDQHAVGDTVTLQILRGNEKKNVSVKLEALPN